MAQEDKLLGFAKNGRDTVSRTYSAYRIDYDSADSIQELAAEGTTFTGATKNPPAGYPGHEAKTNYQRKVLVENATTRDEVQTVLDNAGVSYTTEDVSPSQSEKDAIEQYGAESSLEGVEALKWNQALEDLSTNKISIEDFERGKNPHRGESFNKPGRGRGR